MKRIRMAAVAIVLAMVLASPGVARRLAGVHVDVPYGGIRGEPVRVYYPPDPGKPLNLRFAWTEVEADRHDDRDAWIAYESRSVFPPTRAYGTGRAPLRLDRARSTPRGVLLHSTRDRSRSPEAADLVVLLRVRAGSADTWSVLWAAARTPGLELDPQDMPIYWIGDADGAESLALLTWLDSHAVDEGARESLVDVIAVHRDSAAIVSHLSEIVSGDRPANLRSAAAAGLAWHVPSTVMGRLAAPADRPKDAGR
jgi:hypothetical protein